MAKSVKTEEKAEAKPHKKKRPSGKSNWKSFNQKKKARAMAAARHRQGLPVTRLRNKQTLQPRRSGRVIQHAVRIEDVNSICRGVDAGTQTDVLDYCHRAAPSASGHRTHDAHHGIYVAQSMLLHEYSSIWRRPEGARVSGRARCERVWGSTALVWSARGARVWTLERAQSAHVLSLERVRSARLGAKTRWERARAVFAVVDAQ